MLREIINFTRSLSPECFKLNLQPKEGLHIQIELDERGKLRKHELMLFRKNDEIAPFLQKCLSLQIHTVWVSANKPLDPDQKLHSCSPFCLAFKKLDKRASELRRSEVLLLDNQTQFQKSLKNYFNKALNYCESENQKNWCTAFQIFCKEYLTDFVKDLDIYKDLKKDAYIYVYLMNVLLEDYQQTHARYLSTKVFNKEEFNKQVGGITYGVTDYLTGYNAKKPFLQHHTAAFTINSRVTGDDAMALFKFSQLKANRQLPNPLPIFIEKEELNDHVVKVFNRDPEKIKYSEIIRAVFERTNDLGNYYLLNMQRQEVKDFDFVSSFQFRIEPPIMIRIIFTPAGNLANQTIDDIFEFERKIVQRIFDNQLVQRKKDGSLSMRYFDDIEYNPKFIRAAMFQLVLKYRKAFYDYIYKSKRQAISSKMLHDIMQTGILDNLKQDSFEDGYHSKEFTIKEKLNIWFSLFEFFDDQRNKGGDETMANRILVLQKRMQEIANDNYANIENDQEFAYATGQVIYYILEKSETANRTHALLEPFLQKTDLTQLKMAISRTFAQYKHAISFYKGRFEKLMSEVLSYELDGDLKSLLPFILAGYFADCVMYQKTE